MHIILLSGGSGKRLWPLSNDVRSKQFIPILQRGNGHYESMIQRMFRGLTGITSKCNITVATSSGQVPAIHNSIGKDVDISVEPCRRDTFPAIALAALYLYDIKGVGYDEIVVVCPVDPYVEDDYFEAIERIGNEAAKGNAHLLLMGIEPTYPSEKYGYIIPSDNGSISPVKCFKEKPDERMASEYIHQGALWNGGVFAFKLGYMVERVKDLLGFGSYDELMSNYSKLASISIDYALAEKETNIAVMRFHGTWKDLGTWNTLTEAMSEEVIGKGLLDDTSSNTHIINELDVPVVGLGLKDVVIAASPEGFLAADKHKSGLVKPMVDKIHQHVMMAEKSWGKFRVIDIDEESLTIKLKLFSGRSMRYHSHKRKTESWTITKGRGYAIVNGKKMNVTVGDTVTLARGEKHLLAAETDLEAIEVQIGTDINVEDKTIFEDDYSLN